MSPGRWLDLTAANCQRWHSSPPQDELAAGVFGIQVVEEGCACTTYMKIASWGRSKPHTCLQPGIAQHQQGGLWPCSAALRAHVLAPLKAEREQPIHLLWSRCPPLLLRQH